jgi:hypothetical protein
MLKFSLPAPRKKLQKVPVTKKILTYNYNGVILVPSREGSLLKRKDLIIMNFEEMTIEELNQIIKDATEAREKLVFKAKNTAWEKVVKAIKDYINKYEDIEIDTYCDVYNITECANFKDPGRIELIE